MALRIIAYRVAAVDPASARRRPVDDLQMRASAGEDGARAVAIAAQLFGESANTLRTVQAGRCQALLSLVALDSAAAGADLQRGRRGSSLSYPGFLASLLILAVETRKTLYREA